MPFEYASDVTPNTPFPLYLGWGLFADLHGQQAFKAPIRAFPGSVQSPGYSFAADNRTGWYQPFVGSLGAAIVGFLRFYIDEEGTAYLNTLGFEGKVQADLLTANQTYQLPDQSGTLAITQVIPKVNAEAFAIQAGQPVTLSGTTDCVLALADTYATCAVGLASGITGAGGTVSIMLAGQLTLADWTNVIGSVNLTTNSEYFTSHATPGALTDISPDTDGLVSQYVGKALSPTIMDIRVERPYQL